MIPPLNPDALGLVFFTALFLSLFIVPVTVALARRMACLQVMLFMFTAKIYFNAHPVENRWLVMALSGALAVIVLRSVF